MFNDVSPYENVIKVILDLYSLDEVFEILDITPEQVLTLLFEEGHAVPPPYLDSLVNGSDDNDNQ